ncbi:MAG: preprotein translocase subunit YajC [Candidatus Marinimicrobia bacterium]|nr:preprotein translocase subunit YajC [Candidatus Neomarinimicrobiota bacterium]MDP6611772.1 preprotein translocase subunit YajC [Candidatus Neomarinimicrobiota bacterium]
MNFIHLFAGGLGAQGGGFMAYLPFVLILAIMYFLMIRPQAKRQKEKKKMLDELKKGDRVVTIGGIHGTIGGFKGKEKKTVILKIEKNTSMTVNRSAIAGLTDKVDDTETEAIEAQN